MEEAFCGNQWINKGSDCGYYIIYFGTVASAREALMSEVRTGVPLKVSCKDLHVKKRIGSGSFGEVKEIIWMGENFAMMHMFTNVEIFLHEVSAMSKLLHPNLLHALSSFVDKDRHISLFLAVNFQEVFSAAERIFSKTERGFYS